MSKTLPDFSFQRNGRPLAAWLWELVSEAAPIRLKAGEVLQAMLYGVPSIHTDLAEIDWESSPDSTGHADRFKEAVRVATRNPNFPTPEFVRRLIAHRASAGKAAKSVGRSEVTEPRRAG